MQRSTAVNAQDLCRFLELLLTGLDIIHVFVVVVIFILVAAAGRSVSLPLLGLAAASSPAGALHAGSSSTSLGFLLVASLVFCLLQLDKLLDFLQLWRSWPLVRWILQYCLLVPSCLSATATAWQLAHAATSLPELPALAFWAPPSLSDCSTTSTSLPFLFLLFRRRFFFAGAASSLSDPPAPVFSPGSFLPCSARAHLLARAYSSLTSLILHIAISSCILRLRTF